MLENTDLDREPRQRRGTTMAQEHEQIGPSQAAMDVLYGYEEIGAFLRLTARQAKHRARESGLPTFKLGRIVCARKVALNAWLTSISGQIGA